MRSVKERAMSGERVCGTMVRVVRTPAMICIAKAAGLDFFMYDCEHGNFNFETLHDGYMTGNALGIEGYARVPIASKDYISRILDCGASGIMVPMLETVEQAQELVKYSKYEPLGKRGFSNGANTNYRGGSHKEIMAEANSRVMAIAQIETALAVENAEAIAAVEGIDALLIGPNDLSISLGVHGDLFNPIELEAISKVAKACRKHKKLFCVHSTSELQSHFIDDLSLVMQAGDTDFLKKGCEGIRAFCDKLEPFKW